MRTAIVAVAILAGSAVNAGDRPDLQSITLEPAVAAEAADRHLLAREVARAAGLPPEVDLRPLRERGSLTGIHVQMVPFVRGRRVVAAGAVVTVGETGTRHATIRFPERFDADESQRIPTPPADIVPDAGGPLATSHVERVWFAEGERLIDADEWLVERDALRAWRLITDRSSGRVLELAPLFFNASRPARVFTSNPVQKLADESLTDRNDDASAVPAAAYDLVELQGLDDSGALRGERVTIEEFSAPEDAPLSWSDDLAGIDRSDDRFEAATAYHLIDEAQRYLESLGYRGTHRIIRRSIEVDPRAFGGADNSFYVARVAGEGFLAYGTGGTDDAEDADIVHHEFGHAIQDAIAPGTFGGASGTQARALGEGFGDYWAFSAGYAESIESGADAFCLAEWDARCAGSEGCGYAAGSRCLRRVDSDRTMRDYNGSNGPGVEHRNGEIWASTLRNVFEALTREHGIEEGRRRADTLAIEGHFGVPPSPTFATVARRMLRADTTLYAGASRGALCSAFTQAGILSEADCGEIRISALYASGEQRLIPDNDPAGTTLTRFVPDSRTIERVFVRVDIEHPQRGDLRLVIVAPDGTPAQLLDTSYADVSRGVAVTFGLDAAPVESLDVFRGRSAEGLWSLRVIDTRSRDVGHVRSWAIGFQFAESATPGKRAGVPLTVIPVAGAARGAGGEWFSSDVTVTAGSAGALIELWLGGSNLAGGTRPLMTSLSLGARETVIVTDVVRSLFGSGGAGAIEVRLLAGSASAASWIAADHPRGSLRQEVPGASLEERSSRLVIPFVSAVAPYRANLGVSEIGGAPVHVTVRIYFSTGRLGHQESFVLEPWAHRQVAVPSGLEGWAEIRVDDGAGAVAGYVSVIDGESGDPSLIAAEAPTRTRYAVPVAGQSGAAGSRWRTALHVASTEGGDLRLLARFADGTAAASRIVRMAPRESLTLRDIAVELGLVEFLGTVELFADSPFTAATRIVNDAGVGSSGQTIRPAYPRTEATLAPWLVDASFRTNLLLWNDGPAAAAAVVTRLEADGSVESSNTIHLRPYELRLLSLMRGDVSTGRIDISSSLPVAAWLSIVDNRSGDAVTVDAANTP